MSFLSGNVSFVRYRVDGPKVMTFGQEHLDRLSHHARSQSLAGDGVAVGWNAGDHILDTAFALEKNVFPDHLAWEFWTEVDKLPGDRLKAYYKTEVDALAKNNPSGFASARQKKEAKEAARNRLEDEAKDGRFKKATVVPVLWDGSRREVFFGSASSTANDRFVAYWKKTFEASLVQDKLAGDLEPVDAAGLATRFSDDAPNATLSPFVPGVTPEDCCWVPTSGYPSFLGNEFLVWLWFLSEGETDTVRLGDGTDCTFMIAGGVKLDCPRGQTGSGVMNHEGPARLPEARRALQAGKLPRKIGLVVVRQDEQYGFHLDPERWAISKGKLPAGDADKLAERDRQAERLQHVRDLSETAELLFQAFLAVRLSAEWPEALGRIQKWLARGERRAAV